MERGYQFIANNPADAGYETFKLSEDGGVLFTNVVFGPVTISLNVSKSVVTKYQVGIGFPSQAPEYWSVTFYDTEDFKIGFGIQNGELFSIG